MVFYERVETKCVSIFAEPRFRTSSTDLSFQLNRMVVGPLQKVEMDLSIQS
jgi:hypothetical protein